MPLVWTPIVLACIARAFLVPGVLAATTFLLVCLGVALWQLLEYSIHRQARKQLRCLIHGSCLPPRYLLSFCSQAYQGH